MCLKIKKSQMNMFCMPGTSQEPRSPCMSPTCKTPKTTTFVSDPLNAPFGFAQWGEEKEGDQLVSRACAPDFRTDSQC